MPAKSVRMVLSDALEDLSPLNLDKFRRALMDRKKEPRVRRNQVEGKNFLDIADVLVSTFSEPGAPQVAVQVLREIGCNEAARTLAKETTRGH